MRSMHTAINRPTPTPTVSRSTVLLMCGTVSASTCRSGSATVMAKPSAKLTPRMSGRFFVRVSAVPILVPMGVMDCSAPSENRPMPTTSITPPMRKLRSRSGFIGAAVRHSRTTIRTIGSTQCADSATFSRTAERSSRQSMGLFKRFLPSRAACAAVGHIPPPPPG